MAAARTMKGARAVGGLLPPELKAAFRQRGFVEAAVVNEWSSIVGERLAGMCCPERLTRDGALRVRAQGSAAPELQHLAPQVLERVAAFFGYAAANRLVIVHGPPATRPTSRRAPPRPLSPVEAKALEASLEPVEDERLREALERLGRMVLGSDPA
jgi:hypothetical protein